MKLRFFSFIFGALLTFSACSDVSPDSKYLKPVICEPSIAIVSDSIFVAYPIKGNISSITESWLYFGKDSMSLKSKVKGTLSEGCANFRFSTNDEYGDFFFRLVIYNNNQSDCSKINTFFNTRKYVNIPDKCFREYVLKHFDKNRDGRLSLEEADAIESIECSTDNIYSLKGIEFMSNLRNLHAQGPNGKLKNLDLNNNLFLANVALSENELTELIIDKCVSLRTLYVSNNKLKELTIGTCPGLQILSCTHNHISDLDLQKCPNIEHLSINDNLFTDIDISNLNRIQELGCSNNPIISLIIKDLPYLSELNCQFNSIDTLSLSNLPSLSALYLTASIQKGRYHFSNIPNLTSLDIGNNYLSFFDFSQYHKLFYASCYSNLNEVLDFSSTSNLNALFCGCNENLKTLILKKGTSIEGVTYNRSYDKNNRYIPPQTEIVFVD